MNSGRRSPRCASSRRCWPREGSRRTTCGKNPTTSCPGESERLQRLVESLLDFGRIEARAFRYRFESVDPVAWSAMWSPNSRRRPRPRAFAIELEADGDLPLIRADREALGLALRNLLDNAVKYSPDCRVVWVEMAREGNRLAIRVRDRGMGIPASEQKEIFKKFVRGAGSRAARIQGTGHRAGHGPPHRRSPRRRDPTGERTRQGQHVHHPAAAWRR